MKISALLSPKTSLLAFAILALASAPAAFAQFSIDAVEIPDAVIGAPYPAVNLTTTGGFGPIAWSFSSSPVPPAGFAVGPVSFASTTGKFCWGSPAGNPICAGNVNAIPGTYLFTVHAQDSRLQIAERQFFVRVQQQLAITTLSLPDVPVNTSYSQQLTAVSGTGNYLWSLTNGSLPVGIGLDALSGLISGIAPATAGSYAFTVRVSDVSTGFNASRGYTFSVTSGLQITTNAALPLAVVNTSMAPVQFQATGGTGLVWSVPAGSLLPAGLVLAPDGVLSGTPTSTGVGRFLIRVTDTNLNVSTQKEFTLSITNGVLRIIETQLPPAELNTPYQTSLTPTGGLGPYTFTFGPVDTRGISISSAGAISGSPTSLNTISLPVNLVDSTGTAVAQNFSLQVFPQLSITTTSLPSGAVGAVYSRALAATGGQVPYRWSLVTVGTLPAGITLNADTGVLEGTPANLGTSIFTVRVTDNAGYTDSRQLTLVVGIGVIINTSSLPDGIVGQGYSQGLVANGGAAPLTWTIVNGTLPAGLTIASATGVISGTPTAAGASQFTVRVADAASNSNERTFTLNISGGLQLTPNQLSQGIGYTNTAYSFFLNVTGGRAPYTWSSSGSLPAGVDLISATGELKGTPTSVGTFTFTVLVLDIGGQSATATQTLKVVLPLVITTGDIGMVFGREYLDGIGVDGGFLPYGRVVTAGTLPPGVALDPFTGRLTGAPTAVGVFPVTIQASDGMQNLVSKAIKITVAFPAFPTLTLTVPDNVQPAQQPQFSLSIPSAFPGPLQGNLVLTFASAVGGDDNTVRFASGSRTIAFTIVEGSTQASFTGNPIIVTGTTAGTITLTITSVNATKNGLQQTVTLSPTVTKTITLSRSAPVISSVTLERSTNAINVVVTGYSTTREIARGVFHFNATQGNTFAQSDITVQLSSVFATWFQNTASNATGGQFRLVVPFTLQGASTAIASVGVTLTNAQGTSASVNGQ